MGKPVVATDIPEIRRFNADNGDIVRIANDFDACAAAIREALAETSPAAVERRFQVAQGNSWRSRLTAMSERIEEAIARRQATDQRWDTALRRAYRSARSHTVRLVVAAAALYLLIFQTNLLWWVADPLTEFAEPVAADAIVVFAAGVGESGEALGGHQERIKQAVDLYRAGYAGNLILSSGFVYSIKETEVLRALAVSQGVPDSRIIIDERPSNTHDMVETAAAVLRAHNWRRILLVSSPYHMRRAKMVWRKVGPEVTVVATPPRYTQFYDHPRGGASLAQVRGILQEYVSIVLYWWRGWV
jgi:uncharacterized SAM-binding protein YcdF (DUF218 family)